MSNNHNTSQSSHHPHYQHPHPHHHSNPHPHTHHPAHQYHYNLLHSNSGINQNAHFYHHHNHMYDLLHHHQVQKKSKRHWPHFFKKKKNRIYNLEDHQLFTEDKKSSTKISSYCKVSCCISSIGILLALGGLIAGIVGVYILIKEPNRAHEGALCAAAGVGVIFISCLVKGCADGYRQDNF